MSLKDYLYQKASMRKVPIGGAFELSPVCNFRCSMCYIRKNRAEMAERGLTEIGADQWIEMARQCRDAGTLYLLLTGGEPFLYPEFRRLYETLHEMGFLISINTNGSMITEETVEWLKKRAPERMNITLYGASEATYEVLCRAGSCFERTIHAIRMLHDAGIHVVINGSITPENQKDMKAIIDFAKSLGITANVATYMFPPVRRDRETGDSRLSAEVCGRLNVTKQVYRLNEESLRSAVRSVMKGMKEDALRADAAESRKVAEAADADTGGSIPKEENADWGEDPGETGEPMRCRAGKSTFWISWEGKMTACGMMDFPLVQDPFRDGFSDCWRRINEAVRRVTVMKACRNCRQKTVCMPCAAMIYAETGGLNGCTPYLQEMSRVTAETWMQVAGITEDGTGNGMP